MSFKDQDQGQEQQADQLTFKVGDREFDANSAATKIENADSHISKLEQENAEFRERMASLEAKLEQSTKLQDALDSLKQTESNNENVQPSQNTSGLDEEKIAAITESTMESFLANRDAKQQQKEAEALAKQTYKATGQALTEIYGEGVDEAIANKAKEMGVNPQDLFQMAYNPASAKLLLDTMRPQTSGSDNYPSGGHRTGELYNQGNDPLIDVTDVDRVTSSDIVAALRKHGATY